MAFIIPIFLISAMLLLLESLVFSGCQSKLMIEKSFLMLHGKQYKWNLFDYKRTELVYNLHFSGF